MDVFRFRFSHQSLRVTSPPPDDIPSIVPNWKLLNSCSIPKDIAEPLIPCRKDSLPKLGIICHAYNVTSELLAHLRKLLESQDISSIVFTTDSPDKKEQLRAFLTSIRVQPQFSEILMVPNLGRDVVPFWRSLETIAPYADVFLKLHWKQSPHLDVHFPQADGKPACNAWNDDLYSALIPGRSMDIEQILLLFKQEKLSCVFPRPWPPLWTMHWHSLPNINHAANLLKDLDCTASAMLIPLVFPAGNMFYGSTKFFRGFLDHFIARSDYPGEPLAADGTVLHAIERIYTLLSASKGFNIAALFPEIPLAEQQTRKPGDTCSRRIVVFPVADLLNSCAPSKLVGNAEYSLPYLYQSLMVAETQKLIKWNSVLRRRMRWISPRGYARRIKAWLAKLFNSRDRLKQATSFNHL